MMHQGIRPFAALLILSIACGAQQLRTETSEPSGSARDTTVAPSEPAAIEVPVTADETTGSTPETEATNLSELADALGLREGAIVQSQRVGTKTYLLARSTAFDALSDLGESEEQTLEQLGPRFGSCDDNFHCVRNVVGRRDLACAELGCRTWMLVEMTSEDGGHALSRTLELLPALIVPSSDRLSELDLEIRDIDGDERPEAVLTVNWHNFREPDALREYTATVLVDIERWQVQGTVLRRVYEDAFAHEGQSNLENLTSQEMSFRDENSDGHPDIILNLQVGRGMCGSTRTPRAFGDQNDFPSDRCLVDANEGTCLYQPGEDRYQCGTHAGAQMNLTLPDIVVRSLHE